MNFLKALRVESTNTGVSTGAKWIQSTGEIIDSYSPVDGKKIGSVISADKISYEAAIKKAEEAFTAWRLMPAPKRGEIVRQIGE
ncbi:MAG: aldehyde dehydrogenase family protein, partial [Chitinophagaceae bacterium]